MADGEGAEHKRSPASTETWLKLAIGLVALATAVVGYLATRPQGPGNAGPAAASTTTIASTSTEAKPEVDAEDRSAVESEPAAASTTTEARPAVTTTSATTTTRPAVTTSRTAAADPGAIVVGSEEPCAVMTLRILIGSDDFYDEFRPGDRIPLDPTAGGPQTYSISGNLACPAVGVFCTAAGSGTIEVAPGSTHKIQWNEDQAGSCSIKLA